MTGNEYYEATQKQRRHERRIRETKREIHALQIAGLDDTSARLRLGNQQRKLKAYTDKHGLPRLPHREKAYGIGSQPRALRKDPRPKTPPFSPSDPDEWRNSLTNEQFKAVRDYTDPSLGVYKEINANLRAGIADPRADLIDAALGAFTHDEMTVYRGMPARYFGGVDIPVGRKIPDPAFVSTSSQADIAWDFAEQARQRGDAPVILRVAVPRGNHGAPIDGLSPEPGEAEFLLRPERVFEVIGYNEYRGFRVLDVKVI